MKTPNVKNVLKYRGVTYEIWAYRKLSREEMADAVRSRLNDKKAKRPKSGETVPIWTNYH